MTAKEFLEYELTQSGKQIEACLNGLGEDGFDSKCAPIAMTPREILEHLAEAYQAFIAASKGEEHQWGSFQVEDKSTSNLKQVFADTRSQAVAAALSNEGDKTAKAAYDYIIAHDNYHVAQLVLTRLQLEPDWDSYAIYA